MPSFVFDLDGTLVDSVYQHVDAWRAAFQQLGYDCPAYRLHRKIGLTGTVLIKAVAQELHTQIPEEKAAELEAIHAAEYNPKVSSLRPLPGARDLLEWLHSRDIPFSIVTSSAKKEAQKLLSPLELDFKPPMLTREDLKKQKPDPSGFIEGAKKIGARDVETVVVGDSVWDVLAAVRARFLGVGVLTGGYGEEELAAAGAFRVYRDAGEMLERLNELGLE
ncbi:MAG: HAD family hydrolase [Candidatus Eremiobacteraeota bacterium]|nr:HAD family hydrolase [Candidatus Eremiobacteraeota bacterium]